MVFYIFNFKSEEARSGCPVTIIWQLPQRKSLMSPEHPCLQHKLLITHSQKQQLDLPASPVPEKKKNHHLLGENPDESLVTAKTFQTYMWKCKVQERRSSTTLRTDRIFEAGFHL